jgi:hypothetical protein
VSRRALVLGAVTAATCVAGASSAQERADTLDHHRKRFESPQNFAFELRFSPFTPDVDSDPQLVDTNGAHATPYQDAFGTSPRLLVSAEFDWQTLRIPHLGTVGPGLGVGYTKASGSARFAPLRAGVTLPPGTPPHNGDSGETTSLEIFPFYAVAVLRADVLWREIGIPFVPYAKLGVGYSLWRASNTLGTSSTDGVSGKGHSMGLHAALGLGLNLNFFDEYAAKNFDNSMGVNGTYLFAEYTRSDLTGLGLQSDPLRVGGSYWTFGLAFEF